MEVLLSKHELEPEKTVLDVYIEKQRKYQALCHGKEFAIAKVQAEIANRKVCPFLYLLFIRMDLISLTQGVSEESQTREYNIWLAGTGKELDYEIAKAYEDWAVHGKKVEVEHWLSVCDNDAPTRFPEFGRESSTFVPFSARQRYVTIIALTYFDLTHICLLATITQMRRKMISISSRSSSHTLGLAIADAQQLSGP